MLLVLVSFIAFIALFVLGLRWGVVIIGKVLGRVVYDRHRNAEYIINTGQVPDQLARIRIGPRWRTRPARTWWLYCQTASATTSGASRWIAVKTSRPCD